MPARQAVPRVGADVISQQSWAFLIRALSGWPAVGRASEGPLAVLLWAPSLFGAVTSDRLLAIKMASGLCTPATMVAAFARDRAQSGTRSLLGGHKRPDLEAVTRIHLDSSSK